MRQSHIFQRGMLSTSDCFTSPSIMARKAWKDATLFWETKYLLPSLNYQYNFKQMQNGRPSPAIQRGSICSTRSTPPTPSVAMTVEVSQCYPDYWVLTTSICRMLQFQLLESAHYWNQPNVDIQFLQKVENSALSDRMPVVFPHGHANFLVLLCRNGIQASSFS